MDWRKLKRYINEMDLHSSMLITDFPEYKNHILSTSIFYYNTLLIINLRILKNLNYITLSSEYIQNNTRIGKIKHIPKELTKKKAQRILKGPEFFKWFVDLEHF